MKELSYQEQLMCSVALEQALQTCARQAREQADKLEASGLVTSGHDALRAFAAAIISTNAVTWPSEGKAS